MNLKNNKGITLTTLVVTIIVIMILASITIFIGTDLIKRANKENLETNMLLIQAEAKSAVEEFNFKKYSLDKNSAEYASQVDNIKNEVLLGNKLDDNLKNKMIQILKQSGMSEENVNSHIDNCYYLTLEDLNNISIKINAQDGDYVIKYNFDDLTAEIYFTKGFSKDGITYYSLSDLNNEKE